MPNISVHLDDEQYRQLEELARKSGRSVTDELQLAAQAHLLTELERHARGTIQDPKSPPSS